jgi:hypothetical protein
MKFAQMEIAFLVLLLAIPLLFTSKHLGKALGLFIVIAGTTALLLTIPKVSSALHDACNIASRAAK